MNDHGGRRGEPRRRFSGRWPRSRAGPFEEAAARRGATAQALLRSGREVFARRGYEGATIREITRRARANLGAVTYHFGSKRSLFDAVLAATIAPLRQRVGRAVAARGTPLDRIEAVVRAIFEHMAEFPDTPQLILQLLATGRRPPPAAAAWLQELLALLSRLVREGQRAGAIHAGDPLLLALSTLSQPYHLTLTRLPLREVVAIDQDDPQTRARLVDHAARFLRRGLAAPASRRRRDPRSRASRHRRPS